MNDLYALEDNRAMLARIRALTPQTRPLWGKLDVTGMLAHCRQPLRVATGELTLRPGLAGILFGKLAKRKLASPRPFGKGMPTHPKFLIRDPGSFEEERAGLIALVTRFSAEGPAVIACLDHPFFGPMTSEEWNLLQWKHLDHHMRQFGA
jgi:hypothetical protein